MEKKHRKPSLHADWIDSQAREIVNRLQQAGFQSYLVGGCVRDLLAGIHPKDYDIATIAKPNDVRRLIRGAYVIGKRFRLVLVKRGDTQYEVATFRRNAQAEDLDSENEIIGDNYFGTPEEDAQRRDFTINALFYDPIEDELVDYVDGINDVNLGLLKMIGSPELRLKEDPIRILRAIRLSHKLGFTMDSELRSAIATHADCIAHAVLPRKREEYLKLFRLDDPFRAFQELYDLNVLKYTLPSLHAIFEKPELSEQLMAHMDMGRLISNDKSSPVDLLIPIVQFYAELNPKMSAAELFNGDLDKLLKDELGLFKSEISSLFNIFDLQRPLKQIDYFKRKGPRRQDAFLERENLSLAVKIATLNYDLTPTEALFWKNRLT